MDKGPHERAFVLEVPTAGVVVERLDAFDLYRHERASGPLPAVVFVHGMVAAQAPVRPRDWPVFEGYGRLAAVGGLVGATIDVEYSDAAAWPAAADRVAQLVEAVRARPEVDAERVALWAFSAGGLLVGRWLADPPPWLRCLALSYPLLPTSRTPAAPSQRQPLRPGPPIVLTRVGRERSEIQATVDAFLADAAAARAAVELIEVPDGRHAFDALDHAPRSREAVTEAMDAVRRHLLPDG